MGSVKYLDSALRKNLRELFRCVSHRALLSSRSLQMSFFALNAVHRRTAERGGRRTFPRWSPLTGATGDRLPLCSWTRPRRPQRIRAPGRCLSSWGAEDRHGLRRHRHRRSAHWRNRLRLLQRLAPRPRSAYAQSDGYGRPEPRCGPASECLDPDRPCFTRYSATERGGVSL